MGPVLQRPNTGTTQRHVSENLRPTFGRHPKKRASHGRSPRHFADVPYAHRQVKIHPRRADTGCMSRTLTTEALTMANVATGEATWFTRLVDWVVAARSHRVICLLAGLWVFGAFDVVLTVIAHHQGMLAESNPIARHLLLQGPYAILLYKVGLVSFASIVLLVNRTRLVSELAASGMLLIYTIVAIQWRLCYELYMLTHVGNIRSSEIDAVDITLLTSQLTNF